MTKQKRRMFVVDWVTLVALIVMMGFLIYYFIEKTADKELMDDLSKGGLAFIMVFLVLGIVTGTIYLVKWLTDREKPMAQKKVEVDDAEVIAVISAAVASLGKSRQARPEFTVKEYKNSIS